MRTRYYVVYSSLADNLQPVFGYTDVEIEGKLDNMATILKLHEEIKDNLNEKGVVIISWKRIKNGELNK